MAINIEACTPKDLEQLQSISINTFYDAFKDQNSTEVMEAYLKKAFDMDQLQSEMNHPQTTFYFVYQNEELAGYLKLNTGAAQSEAMGKEALEIERIYLVGAYQKNGLGKQLIRFSEETAKSLKLSKVWLGVWERNERAIAFYERLGFIRFSTHSFFMGEEEQTDYLLEKTLE